MKKVFITGGSGFIGSHLAEELFRIGYHVTIYDINKPQCLHYNNYICGDILDYDKLKVSMQGSQIVCHLAAMVGVVKCLNDSVKVKEVNYFGTQNVANACRENVVENLLFASSSEVYGEGGNEVLNESAFLSPKSLYGMTKLNAEIFLSDFAQRTGIKTTAIRYCNIFGARQRIEFVVPIFINQILQKCKITICDDGLQVRSFTYISDAVSGSIKALFRNGLEYDVFNICSNNSLTILELAQKLLSLSNADTNLNFFPYEALNRNEEIEILKRIPSAEKASKILNFKSESNIDKSLSVTYDYYKNLIG